MRPHAPPHAGAWEIGLFYVVHKCESHAHFFGHRTWWLGSPEAMSCHALPKIVFQKHTFRTLGSSEIPSTKFVFFLANSNPRL